MRGFVISQLPAINKSTLGIKICKFDEGRISTSSSKNLIYNAVFVVAVFELLTNET